MSSDEGEREGGGGAEEDLAVLDDLLQGGDVGIVEDDGSTGLQEVVDVSADDLLEQLESATLSMEEDTRPKHGDDADEADQVEMETLVAVDEGAAAIEQEDETDETVEPTAAIESEMMRSEKETRDEEEADPLTSAFVSCDKEVTVTSPSESVVMPLEPMTTSEGDFSQPGVEISDDGECDTNKPTSGFEANEIVDEPPISTNAATAIEEDEIFAPEVDELAMEDIPLHETSAVASDDQADRHEGEQHMIEPPAVSELVEESNHTELELIPQSDSATNEHAGDHQRISRKSSNDDCAAMPVPPPPAPVIVNASRPVFIGSLSAVEIATGEGGGDEDSDSDDDDGDDDAANDSDLALPPPPLHLSSFNGDDDDELEVDPAVAEEIRAAKMALTTTKAQPASLSNPLLDALVQADTVAKQLTAEVMHAHASKVDEIALAFDNDNDDGNAAANSVQVRAAQVVTPPQEKHEVHPESSVVAFGIGYKSLRKRRVQESDGAAAVDDQHTYALVKGPVFHEFESEISLPSDVSLSLAVAGPGGAQGQDQYQAETDEFGEIALFDDGPVSPTRVEAILEKTRASVAAQNEKLRDDELLQQLKDATQNEKRQILAPDQQRDDPVEKQGENDAASDGAALTLTELHSMYKRGLGDQEVLMLDDDEDDGADKDDVAKTIKKKKTKPKERASGDAPERRDTGSLNSSSAAPSMSLMGRILSKPTILNRAITEEEDEDDEDEEGDDEPFVRKEKPKQERISEADNSDLSLTEDDANAVAITTENILGIDEDEDGGGKEEEWKEIQLLRKVSSTNAPMSSSSTGGDSSNTTSGGGTSSTISYAEALQYFMESSDVLVHKDKIVAEELAPSSSCFSCLSRPRLTFATAIDQRDRFFCIAATSFDPRNVVHVRMLQTIYRKLTCSSSNSNNSTMTSDVPLMGSHWESIGFQGSDPTTDLRGCGVLSLLQLLHLVHAHAEVARRFHSVSLHPVRHFPMACASINVTLQCLVALRSGALYRECNKRTSVFDAANLLHVALVASLSKELPSNGDQIPIVMKRVLDNGRLHPDKVLDAHAASASTKANSPLQTQSSLPQQQQQRQSHAPTPLQRQQSRRSSATAGGRASSSQAAGEFTEIGLHSVADD